MFLCYLSYHMHIKLHWTKEPHNLCLIHNMQHMVIWSQHKNSRMIKEPKYRSLKPQWLTDITLLPCYNLIIITLLTITLHQSTFSILNFLLSLVFMSQGHWYETQILMNLDSLSILHHGYEVLVSFHVCGNVPLSAIYVSIISHN